MISLARFSLFAALGLWSLGSARAETPDSPQNTVPPNAASSTAADLAPSAPPAGTTPAPAEIPLQISRHAANAKFRYPFLGTLRAYVQSRILRVHSRSGAVVDFPVKVFTRGAVSFCAPSLPSRIRRFTKIRSKSSKQRTGRAPKRLLACRKSRSR